MICSFWKEHLPPFGGEMADVRELVREDAPALFEVLADPRVSAHMSAPPPSVRAFEGFIAWTHAERAAGRGCCYGIVPRGSNRAVGIIQLHTVDPSFCVAEWGFAIGAAFWGTGAFLEAAHTVTAFAFNTLGVQRLEARVTPANGRGNGVLQKLGATVEAVLSQSLPRSGKYEEQLLWSLTKESWDQRTFARPKFCPEDAKARIAAAVAQTQDSLRKSREEPATGPAPLYPFFVASGEHPT